MEIILKKYDKNIIQKAAKIKAIVTDVDGVLTSGGIIYNNAEDEWKQFNVKDGQIIKPLRENNVVVGAITGRDSKVVKRRLNELRFDFHVHGKLDKITHFEDFLKRFELEADQVCYLGDDLTDLPCLRAAGLSVCPKDALDYVKEEADLITDKAGGEGVLREVADLILSAQSKLKAIVDGYRLAIPQKQ